jgi:hypothetical protein
MADSITPSPELVTSLRNSAPHGIRDAGVTRELWLINQAYAAGADQELEACCEWLGGSGCAGTGFTLRAARRPKPLSLKERVLYLKERALEALGPEPLPETGPTGDTILNKGSIERHRTICRALGALND